MFKITAVRVLVTPTQIKYETEIGDQSFHAQHITHAMMIAFEKMMNFEIVKKL